ncbi:MAG: superoxide dismutase family protein [Planctomycetes bacterium]|nr:superoxide dismutase family protein [Planctomycetota bacterium]
MRTILVLSLFALSSCSVFGLGQKTAHADLIDNANKKVGHAELSQVRDGVWIVLDLHGAPPGTHAMHIHNNGECHAGEEKAFNSAGPHFNPYGRKHGLENPEGPHAGDLPNIEVKADGTAHVEVLARLVSLEEGAVNSLFKVGGTCVMIHLQPDDNKTDPTGNAGARFACGTIVK